MTNTDRVKYLIIGNSAGGIGAVEAIREVDKTGAIALISDEPYPAYSRPLISEHLSEGRPLERMLFRPADFYEQNNISTLLGSTVERLDPVEHTIKLQNGNIIRWDKLLLATGGLPVVPQIKGIDQSGVFTFTTLDDARAIDRRLSQFSNRKVRAVVIGGGLIGVSCTEALLKRGAGVTIVEMKEHILNAILDEEASAIEEAALRQEGVEIITGHTVTEVTGPAADNTLGITLDNGRAVPCELVIVAIGVRPRTGLVAGTGIKVNRGIVVNRHMATSSPDIYACGDVAEAHDFIYGENRLTPVWPNAYLGGRIAGFNMSGVPTEYPGGTAMNSLKYFGVDIVSAGMVAPPDDSYEVLSMQSARCHRKVLLKNGLVVGMVFTGDIEKSGIIFSLMKNRVNVDGFKQALIADDFGLISLPEEIWRPLLEVPISVTASPVIPVEEPEEILIGE